MGLRGSVQLALARLSSLAGAMDVRAALPL